MHTCTLLYNSLFIFEELLPVRFSTYNQIASDESDLSDGDGYLDPAPDEDYKYLIRLRVAPTTRSQIKSLFINTDKVCEVFTRVYD